MKKLLIAAFLATGIHAVAMDHLSVTFLNADGSTSTKDNCSLTQHGTTYTLSCPDGTTYPNLKRCTQVEVFRIDPNLSNRPIATYQPPVTGPGPHVPINYQLYDADVIPQLAPGTCTRVEP